MDNHSAAVYKDQLIIFGGFFGAKIGLHSNYLFSYQFQTNQWTKLFPQNETDLYAPAPRDGCGMDLFGDRLFVFGGSNGRERFNDLWQFDFIQEKWIFI